MSKFEKPIQDKPDTCSEKELVVVIATKTEAGGHDVEIRLEPNIKALTEAELKEHLSALEDALCALEAEEPDDADSEEYEAWLYRCEDVQDRIDQVEDLLP